MKVDRIVLPRAMKQRIALLAPAGFTSVEFRTDLNCRLVAYLKSKSGVVVRINSSGKTSFAAGRMARRTKMVIL